MRVRSVIELLALFFQRRGEIHIQDTFLSPRLIREALEKRFHLVPIEETSTHLRFRIIRFFRLYGGPCIWPQAEIDITLRRDQNSYTLLWYFFWPEYYVLAFSLVLLGLIALVDSESGGLFLAVMPLAILFFGALIFLDTVWVSRRVRKVFAKL